MNIIDQIKQCDTCAKHLPFSPRPVLQYSAHAKIMLIGQAPGIKAHNANKPWDDASGKRLRNWLGISETQFYNKDILSIVPMGFCYPGKAKSGDLPPRPECAPKWHSLLIHQETTQLILLIGKYAQDYYLKDNKTLTNRLLNWQEYSTKFLLFPHPSPRNNIWLKKHSWFEKEVLPKMQLIVSRQLCR